MHFLGSTNTCSYPSNDYNYPDRIKMEGKNRKIFVFFKRFKTVQRGARLAGIFADFSGP
jgi:hypothetical protein